MTFNPNKYTESPFLKGDDIEDGERMVVTIKTAEEVTFEQSGDTAPVLSFFEVDKKLTLNKTRVKKCVELMGDDPEEWIDQKIALYSIDVNFNGKMSRGIAIAKAPKGKQEKPKPEVKFEDDDEDDNNPF